MLVYVRLVRLVPVVGLTMILVLLARLGHTLRFGIVALINLPLNIYVLNPHIPLAYLLPIVHLLHLVYLVVGIVLQGSFSGPPMYLVS